MTTEGKILARVEIHQGLTVEEHTALRDAILVPIRDRWPTAVVRSEGTNDEATVTVYLPD